jgi:hypothetical protein
MAKVKNTTNRRDERTSLICAGATATAPHDAVNNDIELLALGRLLDAAVADESRILAQIGCSDDRCKLDKAFEEAVAVTGGLARQIAATRATTLEGLRVKARAVRWCYCGTFEDLDADETTDIALSSSIVRDLLDLDEAKIPNANSKLFFAPGSSRESDG